VGPVRPTPAPAPLSPGIGPDPITRPNNPLPGRPGIHSAPHTQKPRDGPRGRAGLEETFSAEAEGLEPPSGFPRRISSAVPYQLGLRLQVRTGASRPRAADGHAGRLNSSPRVGAPGFEPGTSASRTQRSTKLSHAPQRPRARARSTTHTDGVGFEPTRACTHTISNRAP